MLLLLLRGGEVRATREGAGEIYATWGGACEEIWIDSKVSRWDPVGIVEG